MHSSLPSLPLFLSPIHTSFTLNAGFSVSFGDFFYHWNCPEAREHPISGTESHMLWTLVDSDTPSIPLSLSLSLSLSSYPSLPSFLSLHVFESGFLSSSLLVEVYASIPDHQDVQGEWVSVTVSSKLIFLLTESSVVGREWNVVHHVPPLCDRVLK